MLLESINSPHDLRALPPERLNELAEEIRRFVVRAVSVTGGHLGSNLGAVELTIALHRVFESPRDVILWDTGHQAYVHKVLTGRRHQFATLRQEDGLSGYPSRTESEHDWVENSHASTILSYAHGLATAVSRSGAERRVVAVIGDGSMTGGMAFEALNNLGHSGSRCVIVLNDNGRSYAPTVSRLSEGVSRLRLNPSYVALRDRFEHLIREVPGVGQFAYSSFQSVKAAFRELLEPTAFFESLGVRYTGPIDGHDIAGMEDALRNAAEFDGPIVVHVLTQKGRGYKPAEDDEEKCLHDVKVFDPETGPMAPAGMKVGDYTEAFTDTLLELAEHHPQVTAVTAAMPGPTGLLPFQARFPDRFVDVGIAEQHAVTMAAGMAMGGLRPVVAVYSTFFTRAFDQAVYDVGMHGLPVVFALDRAGITGDDGPSHHGVLDMALCLKIPGMTVFAPSSAQELRVMLRDAVELEGPAVVRYPKGAARQVGLGEVGAGLSARRVREGDDVCILAVGKLLAAAEEAAAELASQGLSATVWDVRVVRPLDLRMLADAARHRLVVTVEDGIRVGGAGAFIADALAALDTGRQAPPVLVLGVPDEFIPQAKAERILSRLGLDGPGIAASAATALAAAGVPLA
ncbi:MAG TPA: 1-deoxy-D-xylulose-5-phosphate synthase [Acidimicrobiales bacterium]|nr:1-deoxy-D-xylulose-5-phosphate synthase [Acidimicrobiales bacterium]